MTKNLLTKRREKRKIPTKRGEKDKHLLTKRTKREEKEKKNLMTKRGEKTLLTKRRKRKT